MLPQLVNDTTNMVAISSAHTAETGSVQSRLKNISCLFQTDIFWIMPNSHTFYLSVVFRLGLSFAIHILGS